MGRRKDLGDYSLARKYEPEYIVCHRCGTRKLADEMRINLKPRTPFSSENFWVCRDQKDCSRNRRKK